MDPLKQPHYTETQKRIGPFLDAAATSVMTQFLSPSLKTNRELLKTEFNTIPTSEYDATSRLFYSERIGVLIDKATLKIHSFASTDTESRNRVMELNKYHGMNLVGEEIVVGRSMMTGERLQPLLGTSAAQFMNITEKYAKHPEVIRQQATLDTRLSENPALAETRLYYNRGDGLYNRTSAPLELAQLAAIFDQICTLPGVEHIDLDVSPGQTLRSNDNKTSFFRLEQRTSSGVASSPFIAIPKNIEHQLLNIAFSEKPDLGPNYYPNSKLLFNPNTEDDTMQMAVVRRSFAGGPAIDIFASIIPLRDVEPRLWITNKDTHESSNAHIDGCFVKNLSSGTTSDPIDRRNVFVVPEYEIDVHNKADNTTTKTPIFGFRLAVSPSLMMRDEPLSITQQIRQRAVDGSLVWVNYQDGTKEIPTLRECPHKSIMRDINNIVISCIRTAEDYINSASNARAHLPRGKAIELAQNAIEDVTKEFDDMIEEIGQMSGYDLSIADSLRNIIKTTVKPEEILLSINSQSQTPIQRMVSSAMLSVWNACNRASAKEKQTLEASNAHETPSHDDPRASPKAR